METTHSKIQANGCVERGRRGGLMGAIVKEPLTGGRVRPSVSIALAESCLYYKGADNDEQDHGQQHQRWAAKRKAACIINE